MADAATPATGRAEELLAEARTATDAILAEWSARLAAELPAGEGEALGYALSSPGKRIRPALLLASYRSAGGRGPGVATLAAAVETVHTYSLVHDDLPCMDDDALRRGRPTTHVRYGVATATLVGFRLVPVAAKMITDAARRMGLTAEELGGIAVELFRAGGIVGMVGGQWLDLSAEEQALDLDGLRRVHGGKTGALIRAACRIGGLAARAAPPVVEALAAYGEDVGLAFQVADDVLDSTGTSAQLGKTAGRDEALRKSTYVRLLGITEARAEAERLAQRAVRHLASAGVPTTALGPLAEYIVRRQS